MIEDIKVPSRKNGNRRGTIFMFSFVVLFWTIFDSIMSYITPLLIEERGFSLSMIGFIIATSSITGAFFDFWISKFFKNTDFKRMFMIMFAICAIYPLLLWQAKTIWFFLFVMAIWGVYFDLYGFGAFNFISRYTKREDHSSGFGIVQIFRALGSILAPLIVGLVIVDYVDWRAFTLGWISLGIGFTFFIFLLVLLRRNNKTNNISTEQLPRRKNLFVEFYLWKKIGKLMTPVLCLTFFLFFIEAFFWTLAPLYIETLNLQFGGLFLTAYALPTLIVGWFVGYFTNRFGTKRTAFVGVLIGSLILSFFVYIPNPVMSIALVFFASFFISISLPAINSAYANYISDAPHVEGEIEGLEDFAFNIGYVAGPLSAGILADIFNIPTAFSILGLIGIILAGILLLVTPRHINIR